jgi:hypothetical protein
MHFWPHYARRRRRSILSKKDAGPDGKIETAANACIALTVPEIRKLLWHLAWRSLPDVVVVIQWSLWRRHHQAIARFCHYQRRAASP